MLRSRCILALAAAACGPAIDVEEIGESGSSGSGSTGMTSASTSTPATTGAMTTAVPPDESTGSREPDAGVVPDDAYDVGCSIWDQDCPPGEKCMPYANGGGNSWNATRCSPIAPDAAEPDEPCTVQGNELSGIDTCDATSMCWYVDPETLEGTCLAFCTGSEADPVCTDPQTRCSISGDSVLSLCLPVCDPVAPDCPADEGCYAVNDYFTCAPDASGDVGAYGDPCEFVNVCDPGLQCTDASFVPGCRAIGCCTPNCNVNEPAPCPDDGQSCVPWFEPGRAPPGYDHVGVCAVPP